MKKRILGAVVLCGLVCVANSAEITPEMRAKNIPSIDNNKINKLLQEKDKQLAYNTDKTEYIDTFDDVIIEDKSIPREYRLSDMLKELEQKHSNSLVSYYYIVYNPVSLKLSYKTHEELMNTKSYEDFVNLLNARINSKKPFVYNIIKEDGHSVIVAIGNNIKDYENNSGIRFATALKTYKFLLASDVSSFEKIKISMNTPEAFKFLSMVYSYENIPSIKRSAALQKIKEYFSHDKRISNIFKLIPACPNEKDIKYILFAMVFPNSINMNSVFETYIYALQNKKLNYGLKSVLDERIISYVQRSNAKHSMMFDVSAVVDSLKRPKVKDIKLLQSIYKAFMQENKLVTEPLVYAPRD